MTSLDVTWKKLVNLISVQHDIIKYKETISDSFHLFPPSRPALLDIFCDIIVDKYIASFIHQRNNYTSELEEMITILTNEINIILDKEFESTDYVQTATTTKVSHYSGYGFVTYACQWVLLVLAKVTMKYEQILSFNDTPVNDKPKWSQVPVIMNLLDILCKTLKSKMVGHEAVSIIMKNVAQHRNHLLWVVKYIGERHPSGIVDKIIDCILSEFIPQQEYGKLQSCMVVLSSLGGHHARQLQSALFHKLKIAIQGSLESTPGQKFVNYQTLIYFTLLLASRNDVFELTNASISMIGRIICQFSPKQLEQFFLHQNFGENILRSYYHMTLNILLNSHDLEIGKVLEFLVHHTHTTVAARAGVTCCSAQFSQMCANVIANVSGKLLIQCHSATGLSNRSTMALAVLNYVMQNLDFWMARVVKDGSSIAAQFLSCLVLNDFKSIGEDLLMAILTSDPQSPIEIIGHKKALVLFFRMLDEFESVSTNILEEVMIRSLCLSQSYPAGRQQRFMATIYALLVYEGRMQSQRRRIARTISNNIDLLLSLVAVNRSSLPTIRLCTAILVKIDVITDERFSVPTTPAYLTKLDGTRFRAWPIFVSARVVRCLSIMLSTLIDQLRDRKDGTTPESIIRTINQLTQFLVNFLRTTDARHNVAAVQIVFREFLRSSWTETNNRFIFKKTLKPGWFGSKLVHDYPPSDARTGQLNIANKQLPPLPFARRIGASSRYERIQQLHWEVLLMTLCDFHRQHDGAQSTSAHQAMQWVIRQCLSPSYHLLLVNSVDSSTVPKDLNYITMFWKRFNQLGGSLWSLFYMLARKAPHTFHPPYQTLEALMTACQHLWSTSDCPRRRLTRAVPDSEIFVNDSQDVAILNKQKFYELINSNSDLYRSTVFLFECLSTQMPLAEELKLILPYLSCSEVQTVLYHLAYSWNKKVQKPFVPVFVKKPDIDNINAEDVVMESVEEIQPKNTFSWETLLPALVHARIHFKSLYDQFCRLLFISCE